MTNNIEIRGEPFKANIINKLLWNKLSLEPITIFTSCPKVDVHNASLIKQYGRTYKK